MSEELLFSVKGSKAVPAQQLTLAEAGLKERRDLQEWVAEHPEILGPEIREDHKPTIETHADPTGSTS